jgi:tRNA A58 N-methylase Trm61
MPHRVCPWWLGYFLASPLRRLMEDPDKTLDSYVSEGMTVLEPGPGMGFFTLALARMVGTSGRVVAVDIQPRMLAGLKKRAAKAGLLDRLEIRLAKPESMGLSDLAGRVDFALAIAVVHEMPSAGSFFEQAAETLRAGARLLLVEPAGHVSEAAFREELAAAARARLSIVERPDLRRRLAALLRRS